MSAPRALATVAAVEEAAVAAGGEAAGATAPAPVPAGAAAGTARGEDAEGTADPGTETGEDAGTGGAEGTGPPLHIPDRIRRGYFFRAHPDWFLIGPEAEARRENDRPGAHPGGPEANGTRRAEASHAPARMTAHETVPLKVDVEV